MVRIARGAFAVALLFGAVVLQHPSTASGGPMDASRRSRAVHVPSGWRLTPAGRLITVPRNGPGLSGPWESRSPPTAGGCS